MQDSVPIENEFLNQVTSIIEKNLPNEQFGVSELADAMNMSRSNLLRKIKKLTNLSVSQLISQVRLKRAMELLRQSSLNVSEVSHEVGFGSTSYFIKCFREYYGYPPGEVGKRAQTEAITPPAPVSSPKPKRLKVFVAAGVFLVVIVLTLFIWFKPTRTQTSSLERSIAVLPFKNESNDSTNVYLINGLMDATLNNLQKIKDLKVVSRMSAEKYRNTTVSVPEMARELNVNYLVVGSGQKIGNNILLNIQLIEASTDKHLWAKQYRRETKDIFELQQEIARNISDEIQAVITPEERRRIEKNPTDNLAAYDLFLKGSDLMHEGPNQSLEKAIVFFKKAIALDNGFALAHAASAIAYYYLDIFKAEKKYVFEISSAADNAMRHDPKLTESQFAAALVRMHRAEYEAAIPYLEKALEYNPNSIMVINFLADLYNNYVPNTGKYLEYALRGVRLDNSSSDSVATSYNYLRLSDALIQTGFVDESLTYINKSLAYNPDNPYSEWVKTFILLAKNNDMHQARDLLLKELAKDPDRLEILQDVAKIHFYLRDYQTAYKYYMHFVKRRDSLQLDIYKHEHFKIAIVLDKLGMKEESEKYMESFKELADREKSIYKDLLLASYFAYAGDSPKAIQYMKSFAREDNLKYWMLMFSDDPAIEPIKDHPAFKEAMREIETRFWNNHNKLKRDLEEKGLL